MYLCRVMHYACRANQTNATRYPFPDWLEKVDWGGSFVSASIAGRQGIFDGRIEFLEIRKCGMNLPDL